MNNGLGGIRSSFLLPPSSFLLPLDLRSFLQVKPIEAETIIHIKSLTGL